MNKVKVLTGVIAFLFLLNVGLLFLLAGKPHPKFGGPKRQIVQILELDDQQISEYEQIIKVHQESIAAQDKKVVMLKKEIYQGLTDNKINIDSLFDALAKEQIVIEKMHYLHFEELRDLCNESQEGNFKELTARLTELFSNKKKGRKGNHKELTQNK